MSGHINGSRARAREETNQRNSQKSTGPRDTSRTRYNARRHGLLSAELSEFDDQAHYRKLHANLTAEWQPVETLETFLVGRMALCIVRITRATRFEAEHVNAQRTSNESIDVMLARLNGTGAQASLRAETVAELADGFLRYEGAFQSMLFRSLRELRELQRERRAEHHAPPDKPDVASFGKTAPQPQEEAKP